MNDLISRQAAIDAHYEYCNKHPDAGFPVWSLKILEDLPSAQPVDKDINVPVNDLISRQVAVDTVRKIILGFFSDEDGVMTNTEKTLLSVNKAVCNGVRELPSAQPEWNNHTVACLLADLFYDTCACNYNGIDEWLPEKCEVIDSCPNPVGVACWEQFLKHRAERRTDEADYRKE